MSKRTVRSRLPRLAGPGERLAATAADFLTPLFLQLIFSLPLMFLAGALQSKVLAAAMSYVLLAVVLAWPIAEFVVVLRRGRSIGRWAFDLDVVDAKDGTPVRGATLFLRRSLVPVAAAWLVFMLNSELLPWGVVRWTALGVLVVDALPIFLPARRCLHDYAAGTKVMRVAKNAAPVRAAAGGT